MEHPEHHPHPAHRGGPGYETEDARTRPVVISSVVITVLTLACMAFLVWMLRRLQEPDLAPPRPLPPTSLYQQRDRLEQDERKTLDGYSYDPKTGAARIPIERAMDLIAERGAPKGKGPRTERELNSRGNPTEPPAKEVPEKKESREQGQEKKESPDKGKESPDKGKESRDKPKDQGAEQKKL